MHGLESFRPPWLRAAWQAASPTRIGFAQSGISLTVYPREQIYIHAGGLSAAAAGLLVSGTPLSEPLPPHHPGVGQPLQRLDWWLAVHQLEILLPDPELPRRRVFLQRWPMLPHVPEDLLLPAARICALLTRRPIVAEQVAVALELPPQRTLALLEILRRKGHLHLGDEPARLAAPHRLRPCHERVVAGDDRLTGRLWDRLAHVY